MKAFRHIILILICKGVILGGTTISLPERLAKDMLSCCCAADSDLATNSHQDCSPGESAPCQSSSNSDFSCSEQCGQRCHSVYYKVLLFCEQQSHSLNIQKTFSLVWLSEKGPSVVYSPEPPPPKVWSYLWNNNLKLTLNKGIKMKTFIALALACTLGVASSMAAESCSCCKCEKCSDCGCTECNCTE